MKSYRQNGVKQSQQAYPPTRFEPEITPKVGSKPIDGSAMPNRGDPFGGSNGKSEEEKYRSVPTKANTQGKMAKKPPAKTNVQTTSGLQFISGGGGFGARPQLSSQRKAAVAKPGAKGNTKTGGKGSVTQRGPPFSGSKFSSMPDIAIKKGRGPQISEFAETGSMGQCKFCKRTFNEEALARHVNVCLEKPGRKKRKVFDSSKNRIVDGEQKSLQQMGKRMAPKKEPPSKMPKWKAMSLEFRHGLKSARLAKKGIMVPAFKNPVGDAISASFIKCPICKRSFNDTAAQRHIPFCTKKAQDEAMRYGGKPKAKAQTKPQSKVQPKMQSKVQGKKVVHKKY